MSLDHLETEYHLTPNGWIQGTSLFYGKGETVPPPPDRVLTLVELIEQASGWSREEKMT